MPGTEGPLFPDHQLHRRDFLRFSAAGERRAVIRQEAG